MTLEFNCDCPEDHSSPSLLIKPELPQPGDKLRVLVNLPEFTSKRKKRFAISVVDFDSGDVALTEHFVKSANESDTEVLLALPETIKPGYYLAVLYGSKQEEIVSEPLIIVDAVSVNRFKSAELALQCTMEAKVAKQDNQLDRAMLLLQKAAEHYEQVESHQCAAFALAGAAEIARTVSPAKFESLGWAALKFLLLSGDHEGASDLTQTLMISSSSVSEAVGHYVRTGEAVLAATASDTPELLTRQRTILAVASRSLPTPRVEGKYVEKNILSAMRGSQGNQYITDLNELLHLATSQIAIYSPGVLFRSPGGLALHSISFASELQESSHAFVAGAGR